MSELRILFVEDEEEELESCRSSVKTYKRKSGHDITLVTCNTVDKAFETLDNSFDGAIIDLKLGSQGGEGNQVIGKIQEHFFRIPVAIYTATPGEERDDFTFIGVFRKGEETYHDLFDRFEAIRNTGITRIMGGQGLLEEGLTKVFFMSVLPHIETWIAYGKKCETQTEKALLRLTLNCLSQLLEEDGDSFFPEEVYLYPPLSDRITTGSIVTLEGKWFVILSPACDLVSRNDRGFKTDRILLVEIEDKRHNTKNKGKGELKKILNNSQTLYFHWLPETKFFKGGFLNFRKLKTLAATDLSEVRPRIQISPSFVKDIVARFSSFYARQGQPEIDCDEIIERILTESVTTQ